MDKKNQNKNINCKLHNYIVWDKLLVRDKKERNNKILTKDTTDYQGLEKCSCFHTLGRRTRAYKCKMD